MNFLRYSFAITSSQKEGRKRNYKTKILIIYKVLPLTVNPVKIDTTESSKPTEKVG